MKKANSETTIVPPQFTEAQWDRTVRVMRLTPQEANIVALVLSGCVDKEIQQELTIKYRTLRTHLRTIFCKVDVHSRTELILRAFAIRDGLA